MAQCKKCRHVLYPSTDLRCRWFYASGCLMMVFGLTVDHFSVEVILCGWCLGVVGAVAVYVGAADPRGFYGGSGNTVSGYP